MYRRDDVEFKLLGMDDVCMLDFQKIESGRANCSEQLVSRIAGKPSGPEAEDGRSSLIASMISSGVTVISVIVLMLSRVSAACGILVDGVLKTESY